MAMRLGVALLTLLLAATGAQAAGPQLPCSGDEAAAYPRPGQAPKVTVWTGSELTEWQPPACLGWSDNPRAKVLVTLAGTFRFEGSMNELSARAGRISALPNIPYWSPKDRKWMPLAREASALEAPDARKRRGDFTASELRTGAQFYYWENDTLTGDTVYDLKIHELTGKRAVIGTNNITPVRKLVFTLFEPRALRSVLFLQRLSPGLYRAFIVSGAVQGTSSMAEGHEDTYANRARAVYRYLASPRIGEQKLALSHAE